MIIFIQKAKNGDLSYFNYWLKETDEKYKKEIQNSRDDQKLSVLHYAAKYYHLDLCKLLVVKYEIGNI